MSLPARIESELDRLAASNAGRGNLTLDVDGGSLQARLVTVDRLACAFEQLGFTSDRFHQASVDDLRQHAERLSSKLTYLLESISPIEIDNEACVVQMRSSPPEKGDDGAKYYELVVSREEIRLVRYGKASGQPRQIVPAAVTREVFGRLANDLVQVDS